MSIETLLDKKAWDTRIPTKKDLAAMGLRAPGARWWQDDGGFGLDGDWMNRWKARDQFIAKFTFAIPCRDVLEYISTFSKSIVEVGAGTGFWAEQLRRVGVDVVATDKGQSSYPFTFSSQIPVQQMDADRAVMTYPDRDLLSIWPCYTDPWLSNAIDKLAVGRLLFYIGESAGGCTADDTFFSKVNDTDQYELVGEFDMVQWYGIHDELSIFRKKAPALLPAP